MIPVLGERAELIEVWIGLIIVWAELKDVWAWFNLSDYANSTKQHSVIFHLPV